MRRTVDGRNEEDFVNRGGRDVDEWVFHMQRVPAKVINGWNEVKVFETGQSCERE
jgi:hypothetical protein